MASIADLFFSARLDDGPLQVDAKKAGDKAGQTLGQRMSTGIKKGSADLVSGIKLGAGIAAFGGLTAAVGGTVSALGDAIQAAREDEESQARLGAALKANIKNWDGNTTAIEDTIASRQRLGFTDEEQRTSLALLVVATNDHVKALEIQRAAMDLARLKGISLQEASEALIKVEGGQFRALKALGIQLPKNATATEALAAVTQAAAGSAETYANTSQGKLLASQIKVGEAMEKLGYILLPVVSEAMVVLSDAVAGIATDFANAAAAVQPFLNELAKLEQIKIANPAADLGVALHDLLWPVDITNAGLTQNVEDSAEHLEKTIPEKLGPAFTGAWNQVSTKPAALAITKSFGSDLAAQSGTAKVYGDRMAAAVSRGLSDGIYDRRDEAEQAWNDLLSGLENQMTPGREKGRLLGYLVSDELRKALASKDPALRAKAQATRQLILDQLNDLIPAGGKIGKDGMELLRKGMKSKDPSIRAASTAIYNAATSKVKTLPASMATYGQKAGAAYAAGLRSTRGLVNDAANYVARGAVGPFRASSPPGPESPLHEIDIWGAKTIAAWAAGMVSQARHARAAASSVVGGTVGAFAPRSLGASIPSLGVSTSSMGLSAASVAPGGAGNVYNLTANVEGLVKAKSPLEIARQLGRFARNGQMAVEPA